MSQLIPSNRDLTLPGIGANAAHELRRATDFGDVTARAAWVDRWGDSIVAFFTDKPAKLEEDVRSIVDRAIDNALSDISDAEDVLRALRHDLKEA